MNNLQPLEHQNQRILTTAQLATAYGTDERRISENFNRNRDRYTEGKHYFALEGQRKQAFLDSTQIADSLKHAPILYLWTEKGAWLHAKSLNTDRAWEAYEKLVDDYYRINALAPASMGLEDLIIMQAQSVKDLKAKVDQIDQRVVTAHHRIDSLDALDTIGDPQQRLNGMVRKYARQEVISFSCAWKAFRQAYNTAFRTNITMLLENASMKHGRKLTLPQFLAMTGRLDDGVRVADKMLNRQEVM